MQRSASSLDSFEARIARRRAPSSADLSSSTDSLARVAQLEEDLRLSAELGQALVAENSDLKERLQAADVARDQLLDRLAKSYKDSASLEKKLERQSAGLDSAEASNRTLLSALETDRKELGKLQFERVRSAGTVKKLRSAQRERDDLKQEVDVLNKRLKAAESRARRAADRLEQDAKRPQDMISPSTSPKRAHLRKSSSTIVLRHATDPAELQELNQLVHSLTEQNASLKASVAELQTMLDAAQDETAQLRTDAEHPAQSELSLAQEFNSAASSPALPSATWSEPPLGHLRRQSSSTSDSEQSPSLMAYRLPDGSVKPAFGSHQARRRRSQQLGASAPASQRPQSVSLPRPPHGGRRTLSVDMSRLYLPSARCFAVERCEADMSAQREAGSSSPLDPIADTSPAASRVQSQFFEEPDSPTTSRILPKTTTSAASRADAGVQTDAQRPALIKLLESTSSDTQPLHSSFAHRAASSVTSDSLSERDRPFLSSFSPSETPDSTLLSVGSGQGDSRTAALQTLLEASAKLLVRVKGANLANLEARLKKQNLPGDVGHLAKSTVKDILAEIEGLRELFRRIVEQERRPQLGASTDQSLVARRDFVHLVKLLREMLTELSRLRSIINRVQLDPSLASKVAQMDELDAYEEPVEAPASTAGGLLAPISRLLFSQPAAQPPADKPLRRKPTMRQGPKLTALRSVAAETVNVEFGSGQIKQAVSAPTSQLPAGAQSSLARAGLAHIFAGARSGVPKVDRENGWVALPRPSASGAPSDRQSARLSTAMDAVLDSFSGAEPAAVHPRLLERTLRPRGLSDSSIHSTFISHAEPARITSARLEATRSSGAFDDEDLEATLEDGPMQPAIQHAIPQAQRRPGPDLASSMGASTLFDRLQHLGVGTHRQASRPLSMLDPQSRTASGRSFTPARSPREL